jgi:hypothetical protein
MGDERGLTALQSYFIHLTPLMFMDMFIRHSALQKWHHPSILTDSFWRAIILIYATWPIYTLAWIMALLRLPLSFRPTPKSSAGRVSPWWLAPQLTSVCLLLVGMIYTITISETNASFRILHFVAAGFALPQLGLLRPLLRPVFFPKRIEINSTTDSNPQIGISENEDEPLDSSG